MSKLIESQGYQGDMAEDQTFYFWFTSNTKDGASVAITTLGTLNARRGASVQAAPAGITITEDADSLTGCHRVACILATDAFFTAGADYTLYLTGCTVDSESINPVLCTFSIENRME